MADTVIYNVNTILNIKKERDVFDIISSSARENVNIAYLIGDEIISDNILSVTDKSGSLKPNWPIEDRSWSEFYGQQVTIRYYHFLLTDVFVGDDDGGSIPKTPLFYKHRIQKTSNYLASYWRDTLAGKSVTSYSVEDIKILNKNMEEIDLAEMDTNADMTEVYLNLENKYNTATQQWEIYFVRYAINFTLDDGSTVYQVYTDMLSPEPVFTEASADDYSGGVLISGRKVYSVTENGSYVEITLPDVGDYAIKPERRQMLKLIVPSGLTASDPWFITASVSRVLDEYNGLTYIYDVPEYLTKQSFNPWPPLNYKQDEIATRISSSIYKLSEINILLPGVSTYAAADAEDMHVIAKAYDQDNNLVDIFTTYGPKLGTKDDDTGLVWRKILGVDIINGLIQIDAELSSTHTIKVTYYYEEKNYKITDIDFNPTTNNDVVGKMYVFYLIPEGTGYGSAGRTASIHYLVLDQNGNIESYSQDGTDGNPTPPSSWSGMSYDTWRATYALSSASGETGRILILGEVWIGSDSTPNEIDWVDIRRAGGGFKEDLIEENLI